MKRVFSLIILAAIAMMASPNLQAQTSYTYRDIGTLGAGTVTTAYSVNSRAEVVGQSAGRGFYWSAGSGILDLGTLGGSGSLAIGINNQGDVVGWALTADNYRHGFLWNATTRVMTDLNSLPCTPVGFPSNSGLYITIASKINDHTVIAGTANILLTSGTTVTHACTFDLNTGLLTDLGTLPGQNSSGVTGINNLASPQVTGNSGWGFLYSVEQGMIALPTGLNARSLNDAGGIAASVHIGSYDHAAYWSMSGGTVDLGSFGGQRGVSYGINNNNLLVGSADALVKGSNAPRAFRWSVGSPINTKQDLNSLTPGLGKYYLTSARGVSDNGYIICDATKNSQGVVVDHAFLLTPH